MFKNLNPSGLSTKAALMAIAGNGIEAIRTAPSAISAAATSAKAKKTERGMKAKMDVVLELNKVEEAIADMQTRGVDVMSDSYQTAQSYAAMLRNKLYAM